MTHDGGSSWTRALLVAGAVLGALAVAAGAIGAHALADRFVERGAAWWDLAERYHALHAVATLLAAWATDRFPRSLGARAAGVCFVLGILLFCGGLYARALGVDNALVGLVPVGGSIWLVGWLALAASAWR